MIIPEINIKDFGYDLPKNRIAEFPLEDRAASKLLLANRESKKIEEKKFRDITKLLGKEHHLVFNQTKVMNARIFAKKESGGAAEVLLLNPVSPSNDPQITLNAKNTVKWKCMIGGKKILPGTSLHSLDNTVEIKILSKEKNIAVCEFIWQSQEIFLIILDQIGKIPLPPYIERELVENDSKTYQTVYAKDNGSVASPTAGLHFTDEIIDDLQKNGVSKSNITLHVGAGTFQPVKNQMIADHKMHEEIIHVKKEVIYQILENIKNGKKIVAVGTTSIRTLESLAVFGEQLAANPDLERFEVLQWTSYNIAILPPKIALQNVLNWLEKNGLNEVFGGTELIIVPGYKYRVVDHIITNFHQPESTLILLVAAFLGKDLWQKTYDFALKNDFRFLSYGDSSILF